MSALDRAANLFRGHVWQIENGHIAKVEASTAMQLADALGVSLDWLLRGVGDGPSKAA